MTRLVAMPARAGNLLLLAMLAAGALALLPLHDDPWWLAMPQPDRWWLAGAIVVAYVAYVAACGWAWRRHGGVAPGASASPPAADTVLVAHASQTGFAFDLAQRTARALREAGTPATLRGLDAVDAVTLATHGRALFVVSTTGEGDPPDAALAFVRDLLPRRPAFARLRYAVLALGDREYSHFCGFGHQLDGWLRDAGATSLFDLVEVDNGNPAALRHWQHHLGVLTGAAEQADWAPADYTRWRLADRRELNPGSAGGAAFHLALVPPDGLAPEWQAGDIVEIGPRNAAEAVAEVLAASHLDGAAPVASPHAASPATLAAVLARSHLPVAADIAGRDPADVVAALQPLPHREYSIASLPSDGSLDLLVRRMSRPDGSPGLGSGWLCTHAAIGDEIDVRIRANPNFRPPDASRPMILVGNGTGIAGLRAHIKARVLAGAARNWLLFGERSASRDWFHRQEIDAWRADGQLERVDVAFSRDGGACRYVQDALRANGSLLREWVDDGAAIYVCGSLQGMAPGVEAVLADVLGAPRLEELRALGRYRRDVY